VYKLFAEGSVDEDIFEMGERKSKLSKAVLQDDRAVKEGGAGGGGRGSRGGGGKVILNGVDVSNPNRTFSKEEWDKLKGNWQYIWDKRAKKGGGNPAAGRGRGQGQDVSNLQARSIQALQQATSILSEITGALPPAPGPTGEEATADAGNSFGEASYGGRQPRVHFAQGLPPGGRWGPRNASKVKTSDRRTINQANTSRYQLNPGESQVGMCELDSHADTCCLGLNFVPIYFTGKICDVAPFLSDLPNQQGVQICSGATAFDDGDGGTYILVINEALWFGDRMQHSLINPNL